MRVALEGGIGILALVIVNVAKPSAVNASPLVWIAAGAAGPAVVRARLMDLGAGSSTKPVGFATAYEPARDWIALRIDDIGATVQSRWIATELLPEFSRAVLPPKDIGDRLQYWYRGSSRFSAREEGEHDKFIAKTLAGSQSDDIKRELIVRRAIEIGAYRILNDLRKHCNVAPPSANEDANGRR